MERMGFILTACTRYNVPTAQTQLIISMPTVYVHYLHHCVSFVWLFPVTCSGVVLQQLPILFLISIITRRCLLKVPTARSTCACSTARTPRTTASTRPCTSSATCSAYRPSPPRSRSPVRRRSCDVSTCVRRCSLAHRRRSHERV